MTSSLGNFLSSLVAGGIVVLGIGVALIIMLIVSGGGDICGVGDVVVCFRVFSLWSSSFLIPPGEFL